MGVLHHVAASREAAASAQQPRRSPPRGGLDPREVIDPFAIAPRPVDARRVGPMSNGCRLAGSDSVSVGSPCVSSLHSEPLLDK